MIYDSAIKRTCWRLAFVFLIIAFIGALSWMFGTSEPFGHCIHQRKYGRSYQALHEEKLFIIKLFIRVRLNSVCSAHVANVYQGAITALAGVVVAIFTATLWLETNRLWRAGEKQIIIATSSANAAKQSADALISLERPWLVASVEQISLTKVIRCVHISGITAEFRVPIRFINEGRTTAFVGSFRSYAAIADYPRPTTGTPFSVESANQPVGSGKDLTFVMGIGLQIHREDATRILEGNAVIWLFGSLEYTDFFRGKRTTYFCFDHNMGMGCVYPWGDSEENYMT